MGTKSLTITNEAYEKLAALKEHNESFSDVINKITGRHSLLELKGLLSDKEANEIKKHIKNLRNNIDKEIEEKIKDIK